MMDHKSNKDKTSQEGDLQSKITAKYRRTQILAFMGSWASDMHRMTSMEEYNQNIELLWECFITSEYADDGNARREIFLLVLKLKELFNKLEGKSHEDFTEVDKWVLNQTS